MSMFRKIKRLFIEEDSSIDVTQDLENMDISDEELISDIADIEQVAKESIQSEMRPSGKVDKKSSAKFIDILLKAIDDYNKEGFDYLEFKSALQNLSNMDLDVSTKYKSALAMAKTMNATPQQIILSAKHYLEILVREDEKFKTAVQRQRNLKVNSKQQELKDRKKLIKENTKKIEELKAKIAKDEAMLSKIEEAIKVEEDKVQSTYDNFIHAYSRVTGQILKDIENLDKYS